MGHVYNNRTNARALADPENIFHIEGDFNNVASCSEGHRCA